MEDILLLCCIRVTDFKNLYKLCKKVSVILSLKQMIMGLEGVLVTAWLGISQLQHAGV